MSNPAVVLGIDFGGTKIATAVYDQVGNELARPGTGDGGAKIPGRAERHGPGARRGAGCRFRWRCPLAVDECSLRTPPLEELRPAQHVACHVARSGAEVRAFTA